MRWNRIKELLIDRINKCLDYRESGSLKYRGQSSFMKEAKSLKEELESMVHLQGVYSLLFSLPAPLPTEYTLMEQRRIVINRVINWINENNCMDTHDANQIKKNIGTPYYKPEDWDPRIPMAAAARFFGVDQVEQTNPDEDTPVENEGVDPDTPFFGPNDGEEFKEKHPGWKPGDVTLEGQLRENQFHDNLFTKKEERWREKFEKGLFRVNPLKERAQLRRARPPGEFTLREETVAQRGGKKKAIRNSIKRKSTRRKSIKRKSIKKKTNRRKTIKRKKSKSRRRMR
jgi:hypothetical protein